MQLSGSQAESLFHALLDAFPNRGDLQRMVRFGLEERLQNIADGNLSDVVYDLLEWAEANDRVLDLVDSAAEANPGNAKLQRCLETLNVVPEAEPLERIIQDSDEPFADPESWRVSMRRCEAAAARVEFPDGQPQGTGFLVGPDALMTCYHVVENLYSGCVAPSSVALRFDYAELVDASVSAGQLFHLSENWQIDHSPVDELDFALIRVDGAPGGQPVKGREGMPQRGWLTPRSFDFQKGGIVSILQYPRGWPLKYASGSIETEHCDGRYVRYSVNTLDGSSGAPCFRANWDLVALHRRAHATDNGGIDFSSILRHLKGKGTIKEIQREAEPDA